METKYPRMVINQQRALAIVRIFVGAFFLVALASKLTPHFVPDFHKLVLPFIKSTPFGFYKDFLVQTVVPNHQLFANLVLLGELVVGAGLVLGLFTAPLALLGAFMCLNYFFATAGLGFASAGLNLTFIVVLVSLALGYAGTTWGVDGRLIGRTPHWLQGLIHYEYREF
jgi:thiosulfate dehydrogenase [quinone] large subunit